MSRRLLALAAAAGAAPAAVVSQGGLISNFGCGGFAEFQARLDTVEVACCGDEDCPTGVPAACSVNCALVFSPFYEACGVLIGRMLDDDAAGTAQIAAFDQLDGQCRSSVDLSSALAIITALRDDDSDYLVPPLDGFETYRYTDPQQLASRGGQYATQMASCSTGWSGDPNGGGFGQPGQQCHNAQGQYGVTCPDGTGCSILGDLSDCPDSSAEVVTECTQAVAQRCTPRQCAAACANAQGCISFRYNKQSEVGPDGQPTRNACNGGSPARAQGGTSYCSFSSTCSVDTPHEELTAGQQQQPAYEYGGQAEWHFYMSRNADGSDDDGSKGGGH